MTLSCQMRECVHFVGSWRMKQTAIHVKRFLTNGNLVTFLTPPVQMQLETEWNHVVMSSCGYKEENPSSSHKKKYILSMFPYPSGNLHMGHVRVYTFSDTLSRFYRMNGWEVIHPMGWDAFGLPAENAAIERQENAETWTWNNIEKMKKQLINLGCNFDWWREIATCDPKYYKWTQFIFLKLYHAGLAYRKEAVVNWDPVDQTVLADEQVDSRGYSWRSEAKVEKKLLTQWFIKATSLAKELYEDLDDPSLEHWRFIADNQRSWIGKCNGYVIEMKLQSKNKHLIPALERISVWMSQPERLKNVAFLAVKSDHPLNKRVYRVSSIENSIILNIEAIEPITKRTIPLIVNDKLNYIENADVYIGISSSNAEDRLICEKFCLNETVDTNEEENPASREDILAKLKEVNGGGYASSVNLKDWLISRQRYWGTPIPIIHCSDCGVVPVPENDLPVQLPKIEGHIRKGVSALKEVEEWFNCSCPRCGKDATRETDTMDTFVDSSWYFLRYLDPENTREIIGKETAKAFMPVDLYIGGKEHAVLHLYYARFVHKFLRSLGLDMPKEPFKKLSMQGVVKGKSFRVKSTGKYIKPSEVDFEVDPPVEKETRLQLEINHEKMSKSKHNGVDPQNLLNEFGIDAVRLAVLSLAGPQSERNWNPEDVTFSYQIMGKIWSTARQFVLTRSDDRSKFKPISEEERTEYEKFIFDKRNQLLLRITHYYELFGQIDAAIRTTQQLVKALLSPPVNLIFSDEYEKTLRCILIFLSPICPHLTSELWQKINAVSGFEEHKRGSYVLQQPWPSVDPDYEMEIDVKINEKDVCTLRISQSEFKVLTEERAVEIAQQNKDVASKLDRDTSHRRTQFSYVPNFKAYLTMNTKTLKELKKIKKMKRQM